MGSEHPSLEQEISARLDRADWEGAVSEAVRGYGRRILVYLTWVLQDEDAAGEVFSQFCEDLWKGIPGFRRESSFKTWAYRLAWHAAQHHLRDPYRRRAQRLETSQISRIVLEIRSNATAERRSSLQERLARIRAYLTPEEQTLLLLRIDQEMSFAEVAEIMSAPENPLEEVAVRNRFQRLKAKLKKMAEAEGIVASAKR